MEWERRLGGKVGDQSDTFIESSLQAYAPFVYRLAWTHSKNHADAEDILQEVFLRYVKHAWKLQDEEHRKAWFIRTTINCSRNLFRSPWSRMRRASLEALEAHTKIIDSGGTEVLEAVKALPHKYRTVIYLFYFEDFSIRAIAKLLSLKESTVKSQLLRARQKLKEQLKGDFDDG